LFIKAERAVKRLFENFWTKNSMQLMKELFTNTLKIVQTNKMAGSTAVGKNLSNNDLIAKIRTEASNNNIRFGSEISATYHIALHLVDPPSSYLIKANCIINHGQVEINITQEGDSRKLIFSKDGNKCIVLEREGSVLLCSFF
jgi:hypothetical protein